MNIQKVFATLKARGCRLNAPASAYDLGAFSSLIGQSEYAHDIVDLYKSFDGFETADPITLTWLWPIARIINFKPDYELVKDGVAFADIQFDAEIVHISKGAGSALFGISGVQIAPSFGDFINSIVLDQVYLS